MLAMPGMSRSTVHRELAGLEDAGRVERQARPEGGFLWRIGLGFGMPNRCRHDHRHSTVSGRFGSVSPTDRRPSVGTRGQDSSSPIGDNLSRLASADGRGGVGTYSTDGTPVPQRGTTDSRAPARLELSSGSKEPSERELSLSQDEIPEGWEDAAAAERRLAGLGSVNLMAEWRKLVAHVEGAPITIWRWRGWVLKARGERSRGGEQSTEGLENGATPRGDALPGDERQQRHARDWESSEY